MENEVCENCGRTIGKLEQALVYKEHVVCKECNKKLRDEAEEPLPASLKSKQGADRPDSHTPEPLHNKRGYSKLIGWILIILSLILGLAAESVAVFGLLLVAGVTSLLYARRRKKTRSKSLWFALAGWSVLFVMLILANIAYYDSEAAKYHPLQPEHQACETAAGFWFFVLAFIWFLGALPLFIAAIVTRKNKNQQD